MKKRLKTWGGKSIYCLIVLTMVLQPVSSPGILKALAADDTVVASSEADSTSDKKIETADDTDPAPKVELKKEEPKTETKVETPAPTVELAPVADPAPVEDAVAEIIPIETTIAPTVADPATVSVTEELVEGIITPEAASIEASIEVSTESSDENKPAEAKKKIWFEDGDKATTNDVVKKGVKYVAPQNDQVTVTFTKLPENPGTLSIEEITLTAEQVANLNALSNKAYDITSTMKNGTFEYDLTLPISSVQGDVELKYAEDVAGLENAEAVPAGDVDVNDKNISATLNHFTFFFTVWHGCNNGSISGRKFNDLNGDGWWNWGEPAMSGWTIRLYDSEWQNIDEQVTAGGWNMGGYKFDSLSRGTYYVCEAMQDDWTQTAPKHFWLGTVSNQSGDQNEGEQCYKVTIGYFNEVILGKIFGNNYNPPAEPYCGDNIKNGEEQCDDGNNINGDGCSATCQTEPQEPITGTITISKHTNKSTSKAFNFISSYESGFALTDGASNVSGELAPGIYTITEHKTHKWWKRDSIVCTDAAQNSVIIISGSTATIDLAAGADVTCVFNNKYIKHRKSSTNGDGDEEETGLTTGGGIAGGGTSGGTTGGGVVGPGEVEGEEGALPEVAGAETGCNEWPLWVWLLILVGYLGAFNALSFYKLKEQKDFRWFWEAALTAAGFLVWVYYDKCDWYPWFPYAGAVLGGTSYGYYYYTLKKLLAAGVDQIKT
jgi:cysteine-rich repeat protein